MAGPALPPGAGVALTLAAWLVAKWLSRLAGGHPLANPSLLAVLLVIAVLLGAGLPYEAYRADAFVIELLLAPMVVALAVPCRRHLGLLRASLPAIVAAAFAGAATSVGVTLWLSGLVSLPQTLTLSLLPHGATTGIAMASAERLGGDASLAACLAVITGCFGAMVGRGMLALIGLRAPEAVGAAAGSVAHGVATARMLEWSQAAGACSALAMVLAGVFTAILAPLALLVAGLLR
jgi:putative effector of murein hydrolase